MKSVDLTDEQKAAICYTEGPCRVIACAGSGKTTVMAEKIAHVIEQGLCRSDEILGLTFTNQAAWNMAKRLSRKLNDDVLSYSLNISTFHSFGQEFIRENYLMLGLERNVTVLNRAQSWQLLYDILDEFDFRYLEIKADLGAFLDRVIDYIVGLKDRCIDLFSYADYLKCQAEVVDQIETDKLRDFAMSNFQKQAELFTVYKRYEEVKRENNYIDYGDQIMLPVLLLESKAKLRNSYQSKYKFVFVDEFQDVNLAQIRLCELVAGSHRRITVVGDDDQCIYEWRGATNRGFLSFGKAGVFAVDGFKDFKIEKNFRSGSRILELANLIISRNVNRSDKMLIPAENMDSNVAFFIGEDKGDEATWVARKVVEVNVNCKCPFGEIAILCRQKSGFPAISGALAQSGIPYEVVGDVGFYHRPEVVLALSYLKLIDDPSDELSLVIVLKSYPILLCDRDIYFALKESRDRHADFLEFFKLSEDVKNIGIVGLGRLRWIADRISDCISLSRKLSLAGLIRRVIIETRMLSAPDIGNDAEVNRRKRNLEKLVRMAAEFEYRSSGFAFKDFVAYIREVIKASEKEPGEIVVGQEDSVKLMSIHAAKGLEFRVVFLPGLVEWIFPPRKSDPGYPLPVARDSDLEIFLSERAFSNFSQYEKARKERKLEEERRLFFVGCTRAREKLFFSCYRKDENQSIKEPSVFMQEVLESGLLEEENEVC
ncbi:MAG: ATP-dependent helicase [Actinobacteria bacterium]|nr:ATP-dependent helicase [Actinomycetota bacterium]